MLWRFIAPAIDELGAMIIGRVFLWRRKRLPLEQQIVARLYEPFDGDLNRYYAVPRPFEPARGELIKQAEHSHIALRDLGFSSPLPAGIADNDRVIVRHWHGTRRDRRLSVLALGGLVQVGYFWFDRLAEGLARAGVDTWMMDEPFNGRRTPDGYLPGELILGGGAELLIAAVRQAVVDARAIIRMLRAQGRRVGVVGQSYGGFLSLLLSILEPELEFVVSMIPLADVPAWYRTALFLPRGVRGRFPRFSEAELQAIAWPVNPMRWRPAVPAERIALHAARYDRLVRVDSIRKLASLWDAQLTMHAEGHYSLFFGDSFRRQVQNFALSRAPALRVDAPDPELHPTRHHMAVSRSA